MDFIEFLWMKKLKRSFFFPNVRTKKTGSYGNRFPSAPAPCPCHSGTGSEAGSHRIPSWKLQASWVCEWERLGSAGSSSYRGVHTGSEQPCCCCLFLRGCKFARTRLQSNLKPFSWKFILAANFETANNSTKLITGEAWQKSLWGKWGMRS